MVDKISLKWLGETPSMPTEATWGVPWQEGVLIPGESITMVGPGGYKEPIQSWPIAYWPDGSIKWTAHAASFNKDVFENYYITKGEQQCPKTSLMIDETEEFIKINTGKITCIINKNDSSIIRNISNSGRTVCSDGRLICIRQEQEDIFGGKIFKEETLEGVITNAVVEQKGPIRSVIKVEGKHKSCSGEMLPFILRFYFYANMDSIKIVHTFIYDGNKEKDFIKGIGLSFSVPMYGELYNRHIRFVGDKGLFCESAQLLSRRIQKFDELYLKQIEGKSLFPRKNEDGTFEDMVQDMAVWDSFKIVQDSAYHYKIQKRTKEGCCWIDAAHGKRAKGLAFIGGKGGGLAVGVKNFWQKYPSSLEINCLTQNRVSLKVWLWSPDCGAMDLRHYDTETHVISSYEGFPELRSTPVGIANTSELKLYCFSKMPDNEELMVYANKSNLTELLVCEPEYYYNTKVFGVWSLQDRSTPAKAWIEDQLDALIQFYKDEIEQRSWYGFWNYGDVMHTYDSTRHCWKYDIGGYAWQNTELVPNMWLWYSFLRTARSDIFIMAEAMTRHTSEVDIYHLGEYQGLGSRHNVVHWGCGCKEARISMAGLHRFYYYLTADERVGDILSEVKDADYAVLKLDPMREYFSKDEFPTHVRSGPDWAAFSSNWLVQWERFGDTVYRDKIITGIECLKNMPYGLCSGPTFGYDPQTGKLYHMGDGKGDGNYQYHMVICFGAPQIWMELADLIKDSEWEKLMVDFGDFYSLEEEEKLKRTSGKISGKQWHWPMFFATVMAYSAARKKDKLLAEKAWQVLLDNKLFNWEKAKTLVDISSCIKPIVEIPWISTNTASQWSLNIIHSLELIGDFLPDELR